MQTTLTGSGVLSGVIQNTRRDRGGADPRLPPTSTALRLHAAQHRQRPADRRRERDRDDRREPGRVQDRQRVTTCQLPLNLAGNGTCMIGDRSRRRRPVRATANLTVTSNAATLNTTLTGTGVALRADPEHRGVRGRAEPRLRQRLPGGRGLLVHAAQHRHDPGHRCQRRDVHRRPGIRLHAGAELDLPRRRSPRPPRARSPSSSPGRARVARNATMKVATSAGMQSTTSAARRCRRAAGRDPQHREHRARAVARLRHGQRRQHLGLRLHAPEHERHAAVQIGPSVRRRQPGRVHARRRGCGATLAANATCALTVTLRPDRRRRAQRHAERRRPSRASPRQR